MARKQAILQDLDDDEKLRITGRYFSGEENTSEYADMGLARAHAIKDKLFPEIPDERIEYSSLVSAFRDGARDKSFQECGF